MQMGSFMNASAMWVVGRGPMISIDNFSNAVPGVSVRTIGCRVFSLTNFFSWHSLQFLMYSCTFCFIFGQKCLNLMRCVVLETPLCLPSAVEWLFSMMARLSCSGEMLIWLEHIMIFVGESQKLFTRRLRTTFHGRLAMDPFEIDIVLSCNSEATSYRDPIACDDPSVNKIFALIITNKHYIWLLIIQ